MYLAGLTLNNVGEKMEKVLSRLETLLWNGTHRSRQLWKVLSIFKTGSTLKCRDALAFNFTSLNHLLLICSPRLVDFRTIKDFFLSFNFKEVICKILNDFFGNLGINVLMQGKLIVVAYSPRIYWDQFSVGGVFKQE